ncbi:Elongin-B [Plecturocebus cupreus]
MNVFLMIRCHKTTIFTDSKESSPVFKLKHIIEGILKQPSRGCTRTTNYWMTARPWASVASPNSRATGPSHSGAGLPGR